MMRLTAVSVALSLAGVVAGCASTSREAYSPGPPARPPTPSTPASPAPGGYRASDFAWSVGVGANTLLGTVAHHGRSNPGWSCAGQSAALTPETRYSAERIQMLYGSARQAVESVAAVRTRAAANPGADYSAYVRSTTCDGRNSFAFRNLPDGAYFIIVRVHPTLRGGGDQDAVVIMQRVEVRGGGVRQVVLPEQPDPR